MCRCLSVTIAKTLRGELEEGYARGFLGRCVKSRNGQKRVAGFDAPTKK
jgi:hypothetical protein